MAQKLAPAEKNSTVISAASATFCISDYNQLLLVKVMNAKWSTADSSGTIIIAHFRFPQKAFVSIALKIYSSQICKYGQIFPLQFPK